VHATSEAEVGWQVASATLEDGWSRRAAVISSPKSNTLHTSIQLAVIGGGPAGLRAAEVAAAGGVRVTVFDAQPSVGRKLLVAGKGGLNLTNSEQFEHFATRYTGPGQPAGIWHDLLREFDADALRAWASGLGVATFQASNNRVYPQALKAAPLLRRWVERLRRMGVGFAVNHRLTGIEPGAPHRLVFATGEVVSAEAVVFALGGASWPQTGSDGAWTGWFKTLGIDCHALVAANCGWRHPWPPEVLASADGQPLKNIHASVSNHHVTSELLITRYGLEGGAIYQLGPALRGMLEPAITIDLKPTFTHAQLVAKMESVRRDFLDAARVRWRLGTAAHTLLARRVWHDAGALAREVKHCVIPLDGPQPVAEAISTAGGVCWHELDGGLMVTRYPGVFVAGGMIDWEAPTGGYLLQGCFATGTRAGRSAAAWLQSGD